MTKQIKLISFNLLLLGFGFLALLLMYSNSSAFNFTSILTISLAVLGGIGLLLKNMYGWIFSNTICTNYILILIYNLISSFGESESLSQLGIFITLIVTAVSILLAYSAYYLNKKSTINFFNITDTVRLISFFFAALISAWEIYNIVNKA